MSRETFSTWRVSSLSDSGDNNSWAHRGGGHRRGLSRSSRNGDVLSSGYSRYIDGRCNRNSWHPCGGPARGPGVRPGVAPSGRRRDDLSVRGCHNTSGINSRRIRVLRGRLVPLGFRSPIILARRTVPNVSRSESDGRCYGCSG